MAEATVRREDFLRVLEAVAPGLASKELIDQSTSYLFHGGRVYTFNNKVTCSAPSGLPDEVEGAVVAKPLRDLLGKLPEETVVMAQGEGELLVRGERRRAGVNLEPRLALAPGQLEQPTSWTKLPDGFSEALRIAGQCCGANEQLQVVVCVHLCPEWLESCDGTQMIRYMLVTGLKTPVIARGDALKHLVPLDMTEVGVSANWLHFRNPAGLTFACKLQVGTYPNLSPHLEPLRGGKPATLPKGLKEAADKAQVFSVENVEEDRLRVELKPGKIKVTGQGIRGWYSEVTEAKYDGKPLVFSLTPDLLREIAAKQDTCLLTDERIRIDGGRWTYVACLGKVQQVEANGEPESEPEEAPKKKGRKKVENTR